METVLGEAETRAAQDFRVVLEINEVLKGCLGGVFGGDREMGSWEEKGNWSDLNVKSSKFDIRVS